MQESIAVLDFGSQYTQVIARRIRECNVYSRIYPYDTPAKDLARDNIKGIILSGGPATILSKGAPVPDKAIFDLGIPVLGICYGLQLIAHMLGGKVEKSSRREYGHTTLEIVRQESKLLAGLPKSLRVWNSHGDRVMELPKGFAVTAISPNSDFSSIEDTRRNFFGLQFHPEVSHSEHGILVLENFIRNICDCSAAWSMANYLDHSIDEIRRQVGDSRVILGLSGGVDSSVAAALLHKAIGDRLVCVFVDNGLLRMHEREGVENLFKRNFKMNLRVVNAGSLFLGKLKGVSDPERKRKLIGHTFIKVFEDFLKKHGEAEFLAQGTLYPDVIESVAIEGNPAATIKSHHNVGGLPKRMKLKVLEPLRELFKDEVRTLGAELGLPREVLWRQPFPGPGLAVRVVGEVTRRNLSILRQADAILHEEMMEAGLYYKVWQSFAVFLPVRSVGVMGDKRTYENAIALRIVESVDAMTADWVRMPNDVLQKISTRIINEVKGINRVVLDISSKPPSTIEWE